MYPTCCYANKVKGQISKRVFQENKACQIFRKTSISYPLIRTRTCAYQGVRNVRCLSGGKKCSFFGKFGMLCFCETPALRFTILPYYRRNNATAIDIFAYWFRGCFGSCESFPTDSYRCDNSFWNITESFFFVSVKLILI